MSASRRGLPFVAALLAAACIDQGKEVEQYRSLLDAGQERTPEPPHDEQSLGVREALLLANARNEELGIAGESYVRALVDRRRALAPFLPTITLSPSYFVEDERGGTRDGVDVPVTGSMQVNPKSDAAAMAFADSEILRQRAQLYDTQDALLIDVARTMFEVLRAERSATVLEQSLSVQEARVDDVRARRDVGVARPIDVSLTEAQAADARVDLVEARRLATTGRSLLTFLTGVPLETTPLDGTLDVPAELAPIEDWQEQAQRDRQDVLAAFAAVDSAEQAVEAASGQWWPSLRIDLERFLSRDSQPTEQDWNAFIAVDLPIFSAGRIHADVRDALSVLRATKLGLSLSQRGAKRDVDVAWENLRASRERVDRLQVRLDAAREALVQAEGLYDAGLGTNLERLVAQDQQLTSELSLRSAEIDRSIFYLDLLRTSGALHRWLGLTRAEAR